MSDASFVFVGCQPAGVDALKREVARVYPEYRFAYSRPGFATFKAPGTVASGALPELNLVFARVAGLSLGKCQASAPLEERAMHAWQVRSQHDVSAIHVWEPETRRHIAPEDQPGPSDALIQAAAALEQARPAGDTTPLVSLGQPESALPALPTGARVLNLIVLSDSEWWLGLHQIQRKHHLWPGGQQRFQLPQQAVSRAYVKLKQCLEWSEFPVQPGDTWIDLGSAPGGTSQYLLEQGYKVLGIDPALMDERVLAMPGFQHFQMRGADIPRDQLQQARWLSADINVAPNYTLDTVEDMVRSLPHQIEGLLLTLKLMQWSVADALPRHVRRVKDWGFRHVVCQQLYFHRQEVCLAARLEAAAMPLAHRQAVGSLQTAKRPSVAPKGTSNKKDIRRRPKPLGARVRPSKDNPTD